MKKSGKNCSIFFLLAAIVSSNFLSVYAEDEIYINAPGSGNVIINNTEGEITYGVRGENQPDQFFDCWNNGSTTRKGTVETGYLPSDTNRENKVFVLKVDKCAGGKPTVSGGFNYVFPEYTAGENGIVHFSYRQYLDFDGSIPLYGAGYETEGLACLSYDKNAHEKEWAGSYDSKNHEISKDIVRIGKAREKMKVYPRKDNLGTEVGAFINGWNKFDYVMNFTSGKADVYLNGTKVVSGIDTISSNMSATDVLRKIQTNYTGITAEGTDYDQGYHYAYYDDFLLERITNGTITSEMGSEDIPYSGYRVNFSNPVNYEDLEKAVTVTKNGIERRKSIKLSADGKTAVISEENGFESLTEYTITISDELCDVYMLKFDKGFEASFVTEYREPFFEVYPKSNLESVPVSGIALTFSQSIGKAALEDIISIKDSDSNEYEPQIFLYNNGKNAEIGIKGGMDYNKNYSVAFDKNKASENGINMEQDILIEFTTSKRATTGESIIINNTEGEITYGVRGENQPDQFFYCWNNGSTTRKGTVETGYLPSDTEHENKVFVLKIDKYAGEKTPIGGFNYVFPEYSLDNGTVHFGYKQYLDSEDENSLYHASTEVNALADLMYDINAHEREWAGTYSSSADQGDIIRVAYGSDKRTLKKFPRRNNGGVGIGDLTEGWNSFDYIIDFKNSLVTMYLNDKKVVSDDIFIDSKSSASDVLRKLQTNFMGLTAEGDDYNQGYYYAYYDDFILEKCDYNKYEISQSDINNIEISSTGEISSDINTVKDAVEIIDSATEKAIENNIDIAFGNNNQSIKITVDGQLKYNHGYVVNINNTIKNKFNMSNPEKVSLSLYIKPDTNNININGGSTVIFTDENGKRCDINEAQSIRADFVISNPTLKDENVSVIVAAYDKDNRMVALKTESNVTVKSGEYVNKSINIDNAEKEITTVKLFIKGSDSWLMHHEPIVIK